MVRVLKTIIPFDSAPSQEDPAGMHEGHFGTEARWIGGTLALIAILATGTSRAQVGPGEFDAPVGADPSIGETSRQFMDNPSAGDDPSIGETSRKFIDDRSAGDDPSIGESSGQELSPGEGAPYGRLRPFGQ